MGPGVGGGDGHGAVVVLTGDRDLGVPDGPDGLHPAVHRPGGHEHHCVAPPAGGWTGHALAVVAIGGGDGEGAALGMVPEELVDGVGGPQGLEGVEAKAFRFVLQVDALDAQGLRQGGQRDQRCGCVARQGPVEGPDGGEGLLVAAVGQGALPGAGVDNQFQN